MLFNDMRSDVCASDLAAKEGSNSDGDPTTAISGQPDLIAGFPPEVDAILQATTQNIYDRFLGIVAKSRGFDRERADTLAQGRVWDGGSARQLGLVDQFGGLEEALARSDEHTSELKSLMRNSYAVFCWKKIN